MDSLPLHPTVVHLPMALAVLMPVVAAGLVVAWWRGWLPRRVWLVAVGLQLILVATSIVAVKTGEAEEDKVEHVVASESTIEAHEEAAEVFLWATVGGLLLFLGGALIRKEALARTVAVAALAGSFVVLALGYRVGHAGGELVYLEGAARAYERGHGQTGRADLIDGRDSRGDSDESDEENDD